MLALRQRNKDLVNRLLSRADQNGTLKNEVLLPQRCAALLACGNRAGALELVDSVPSGAESARILLELGIFCRDKLHDVTRAIRLFSAAHYTNPTHHSALQALCAALNSVRNEDEAVGIAERAVIGAPKNWNVLFCAGQAHMRLRPSNVVRAALYFEQSLRIDPDQRAVAVSLFVSLRASRGVEEARKRLEHLAEEFPDSAWLSALTGSNYTEYEPTDFAKAAEWLDKAIRLSPNERNIIAALATTYDKAFGVEDARRRHEQLAEEFPDSAWLAEVTARSYGGGDPNDFASAAEWHQKAFRLENQDLEIVNNLAIALRASLGVEEARKRLEQLAEEFPDSAWLAAVTGSNYTGHEPTDFAKASEWFDKAVRLSPNEREIIGSLTIACDKVYGVEETRKRLEQLAEEFPDSAWLAAVTGVN